MPNISAYAVDSSSSFARQLAAVAMHEALASGVVEAAPGPRVVDYVLCVDGVPSCRVRGSEYRLALDRGDYTRRPLTPAEESLPVVAASGPDWFAGCELTTPCGLHVILSHSGPVLA